MSAPLTARARNSSELFSYNLSVTIVTHTEFDTEKTSMYNTLFLKATLERAIKTFAQTALAMLGAQEANILTSTNKDVLFVAGSAAIISVLTSFASGVGGRPGPSLAGERIGTKKEAPAPAVTTAPVAKAPKATAPKKAPAKKATAKTAPKK